jgi:hypothetical protein
MGIQSVTEDSTSTLTDSAAVSSFSVTYLTSASTSPGGHHHGGFVSNQSSTDLPQVAVKSSAAASASFSSDKIDNAVRDQVFASFDLLYG